MDFDLDGHDDLVFAALGGLSFHLVWMRNGGPGVGLEPTMMLGTYVIRHVDPPLVGDADGDGDDDIFIGGQDPTVFPFDHGFWLLNESGQSFTSAPGSQQQFNAWHVADISGDGRADVVFRGVNGGAYYKETLPGGQLSSQETPWIDEMHAVSAVRDFDGDGLVDAIIRTNVGGMWSLKLIRGLAGGAVTAPATLWSFPSSDLPTDLSSVDVDGDSLNDLVLASRAISVWLQALGGGTFGPPQQLSMRTGITGIGSFMHDFDRDGDVDLFQDGRSLSVRLGESRVGLGSCIGLEPNSTGRPARMYARGTASVAANDLTLGAHSLPLDQFGIFLVSASSDDAQIPVGTGTLCLGGVLGRFTAPGQIRHSGNVGGVELSVDSAAFPGGGRLDTVSPGDTRYFQYWTRDLAPDLAHASSSLAVIFTQ